MAADVAAGRLYRCGAGVAGEVALGLEAGDVAGVADDLGRQDRTDAVDLGQRRAAASDLGGDGLAHGAELASARRRSSSRSRAIALRWWSAGVSGRTRARNAAACGRRQLPGGAAGLEVAQQYLEPVHGAGRWDNDVVSAVREQAQHDGVTSAVTARGLGLWMATDATDTGVGQVRLSCAATSQADELGRPAWRARRPPSHRRRRAAGPHRGRGPAAPSTAHSRSGHSAAQAMSVAGRSWPIAASRRWPSVFARRAQGGRGDAGLVGVDTDHDH